MDSCSDNHWKLIDNQLIGPSPIQEQQSPLLVSSMDAGVMTFSVVNILVGVGVAERAGSRNEQ